MTQRKRQPASTKPKAHSNNDQGIRLQKALARAGVASRRHCEQLITDGQVTVNQNLVSSLPAWVDTQRDIVRVSGRIINIKNVSDPTKSPGDMTYIALHKPRGVISTCSDPVGRRNVLDMIQDASGIKGRVYPVGRLDADSTGLMLLTNDGELAHRLTHPRFGIQKNYHVTVSGRVSDEDLAILSKGVMLTKPKAQRTQPIPQSKHRPPPKGQAARASVAAVRRVGQLRGPGPSQRTKLVITLTEGQNRQIRRMLAKLGYKVGRLKRVAFGPVGINRLTPGRWRYLERREIIALRRAAGLRA